MSRAKRKAAFIARIEADLCNRTEMVNIVKDEYGFWQVKCFDKRGRYIGGTSGTRHLHEAQSDAYRYIGASG